MAKARTSLPHRLIAALGSESERRGTTRSGLLRHPADDALRRRAEDRAQRVDAILRTVRRHGGDGVDQLDRDRSRA